MTRIAIGCVLCIFFVCSPASAQKADAQKTLTSFGDFVTGGTWKSKDNDGKETTLEYSWFANRKLIRISVKNDGKPSETAGVIGLHPKTKMVTIWGFAEDGVKISTVTRGDNGVWNLKSESTDEVGKNIVWKGRFTQAGRNELRLSTIEVTVDGAKVDYDLSQVWNRG